MIRCEVPDSWWVDPPPFQEDIDERIYDEDVTICEECSKGIMILDETTDTELYRCSMCDKEVKY